MTDSQELDVLCYILVVSVGLSILFNRNASSGGLDIVAKIMNKYLHMELGKAMSLSGMCVALSAALVYDKKTVVLSILGTYFNGIVLDHFIFDNNIKRRVCIITKKEEELRQFIIHDLHSGATIYEAIGAYNMEKRREIITIVDKGEYQKLMKFINQEDPKAFITVYNVSNMRYQPKKKEYFAGIKKLPGQKAREFFTIFYRKIYFRINSTASTYIRALIFFSFALPVIRLMATYVIIPMEIPSEML